MAVENYKFYHLMALWLAFLRYLFVHHSILKVYIFNTIFTPLQDDSNVRPPPKKNMAAKRKCIYWNLHQPPKIKCILRKYILVLIAYI